MGTREIKLHYSTMDRFSKSASFKTLAGAQKFAHKWVGKHPDISETFGYAVSMYGDGKITFRGVTSAELFPEEGAELKAAIAATKGGTDLVAFDPSKI
jgi:hypothetical protein